MIENLSDTVIMPIAGIILTFVMYYELIQMVIDETICVTSTLGHLQMDDEDLYRRGTCHKHIPVMMGIFDVAQSVIGSAAGVIIIDTAVGVETLDALREMGIRLIDKK